ncbi:helicase-related protein [Azospirillum argentinense]|uniref:Helicase-related protein n=1 Tax=Azospirillum argentinense TaxID=2970906 RepID=A0ABW8V2A8_9PROT
MKAWDGSAARIRKLRRTLGLRQPEFAAKIGVAAVTVSRWENGQNQPTELAWARISEIEACLTTKMEKPTAHGGIPGAAFTAPPEVIAAVTEIHRLAHGHLASPAFATEVSLIDPLPHQRIAVYDHILKSWPIRFLLADDAGAGKTIMAGLTIRELLFRRLVQRVLVVAPAGLVGNWERELRILFRIHARIIRGADSAKGNPFMSTDAGFAVVSVDTLRSERTFQRLREAGLNGFAYDLVLFDEAHKLSADRDPDLTVRKTARYRLAEALAGIVSGDQRWDLGWAPQGLMLLTATPHMGKEYPYFALWRLLEPDAISTPEALASFPAERRARHFIRRTKEEMVKLDGSQLYPPRKCDTLGYELTQGPDSEQALYDETTKYIRDIYNRAATLNRSAARLAMSVFQRRLASSTYALMKSFERRSERLAAAIKEVAEGGEASFRKAQADLDDTLEDLFETTTADDDQGETGEAHEDAEDKAMGATVAETLADLMVEREKVEELRKFAKRLIDNGVESKFSRLLEALKGEKFRGEKVIIFTEHRDTALYLSGRLEGMGYTDQVAQLHGGMDYLERDRQVEFFRAPIEEGGARFLIATDAAGEGVNLQFAWIMVNYDVPWNPARLEQRMGRIHRYGQKKPSVLISNLVALKTREGQVIGTLLKKLEDIRKALGSDKVFDVVGRLFQGVSLKTYLEASLQGDAAAKKLEGVLTADQVRALEAREKAIYGDGGEVKARLSDLREDMEQEQYLRLMPGYVQRLLERALPLLGLAVEGDAGSAFHLRAVKPGAMDRVAAALEYYPPEARERLTVRRPEGKQQAIWLHPGEPVFEELASELLERFEGDALRGAMFVDPTCTHPWLFHLASFPVVRRHPKEDDADVIEHRLVALRQEADGSIANCSIEHLLLLRGLEGGVPGAYTAARASGTLVADAERFVKENVAAEVLEAHRDRVARDLPDRIRLVRAGFSRQEVELAKARTRLREAAQAGKKNALQALEQVKRRQTALSAVRDEKLAEIQAEPELIGIGEIRFLARALVVPSTDPEDAKRFDADVEATAVKFVAAYEETAGARVQDVSKAALAVAAGLGPWPGFDLWSHRPGGEKRCIEVKGRADTGAVVVSDNEWAKAAILRDRYWLYVVLDCATPAPRMLRIQDPHGRLLGTTKGGISLKVGDLVAAAEAD